MEVRPTAQSVPAEVAPLSGGMVQADCSILREHSRTIQVSGCTSSRSTRRVEAQHKELLGMKITLNDVKDALDILWVVFVAAVGITLLLCVGTLILWSLNLLPNI